MKKIWILLLIIILLVLYNVFASESSSAFNYLTRSIADKLYCSLYGNCNLNTLTVGNLTVYDQFINATVVNYNVSGNMTIYGDLIVDRDNVEDATLVLLADSNKDSCINLTEGGALKQGFQICNDGSGINEFRITNLEYGYDLMTIDRDDGTINFYNDTVYHASLNVTGDLSGYALNMSFIYGALGVGGMDLRASPWYLGGVDLEIDQDLSVGNISMDGNLDMNNHNITNVSYIDFGNANKFSNNTMYFDNGNYIEFKSVVAPSGSEYLPAIIPTGDFGTGVGYVDYGLYLKDVHGGSNDGFVNIIPGSDPSEMTYNYISHDGTYAIFQTDKNSDFKFIIAGGAAPTGRQFIYNTPATLDPQMVFDSGNDGYLTWYEDEQTFDFSNDVDVNGDVYVDNCLNISGGAAYCGKNINSSGLNINSNTTLKGNLSMRGNFELWKTGSDTNIFRIKNQFGSPLINFQAGITPIFTLDAVVLNRDYWYNIMRRQSNGGPLLNLSQYADGTRGWIFNVQSDEELAIFPKNAGSLDSFHLASDGGIATDFIVDGNSQLDGTLDLNAYTNEGFLQSQITGLITDSPNIGFNPIFKENVTFQENVTIKDRLHVGDTIIAKNITIRSPGNLDFSVFHDDDGYPGFFGKYGDFFFGVAGDTITYMNYYSGTGFAVGATTNRQEITMYGNTLFYGNSINEYIEIQPNVIGTAYSNVNAGLNTPGLNFTMPLNVEKNVVLEQNITFYNSSNYEQYMFWTNDTGMYKNSTHSIIGYIGDFI